MSDSPIYLDYAAATPTDARVSAAMQPYASELFFNPSATYSAARSSKQALNDARAGIAHWLGARSSEIIFTAGGSEANNLAIHGVMRQYKDATVVVSAVEHDSVLAAAQHYDHRLAVVGPDARVDVAKLLEQVDDSTVLVSVMYANNEVGTIQPLREIARGLNEIRQLRLTSGNQLPLYFHTDACQAANYLDMHVARLGVDLLTLNSGKIYGPKQVGALYVKGGLTLLPLIDGGGQERGLRSGTENVAGAVGLARALELVQANHHQEAKRLQAIQQHALKQLAQLPNVTINGARKARLPNNIHLTIEGQDNERLLMQLDEVGIMAAAGSACSASNDTPSHVLRAMGLSDNQAQASLRVTMGQATTQAMMDTFVARLQQLITAL